jgi:hypothetical protein
MRYMVKLNERKIRWIIREKLRGRGTGEVALIQRVSRRRVEQLWQAYRLTGVLPALKKPGRPKKTSITLKDWHASAVSDPGSLHKSKELETPRFMPRICLRLEMWTEWLRRFRARLNGFYYPGSALLRVS